MNYHYFNDKINNKTVNNLVDKLQSMEGKIILQFATTGGNVDSMRFLILYLNSRKENIKIIFTDELSSAGADILIDFEGDMTFDEGLDFIFFHCGDRMSYPLRASSTINWKIVTKQDVERNRIYAEKIKNKELLTPKQLKDFNANKDVIVYKEQFKEYKFWKL